MPRRNNGPKLVRLKKRPGSYYISYTENGRSRQLSTGTGDRRQAEIALAEFIHGRQRNDGPRDPAEILVTDVLADYAEDREQKVAAPVRIASAITALVPFWQGKTVDAVTSKSCSEYETWRGRAPGTVRRELGVLRAAINRGVRARRLTYAVPVDLPHGAPPKDRWLTKREASALLWAALKSPHTRLYLPLFIIIGLHTGQRKEAILSLRWPQVDLEAGVIKWNPQDRRQTSKRRPTSRIPPKLLPHLRRARGRGTEMGFVIHENGKRLGDIKKGFAGACQRAGLDDVSPHTLRHTRATWGMQRGSKTWELAGFLGMTEETLVRVYGHHHPDYQHHAAVNY